MIRGITIQLVNRVQTGTDGFGKAVYEETTEDVENVLVGQPTRDEQEAVAPALNLSGKRVTYILGIPKGDTHCWEDRYVLLPPPFSGRYRTVGYSIAAIEALVPMSWNRKVMVEQCE